MVLTEFDEQRFIESIHTEGYTEGETKANTEAVFNMLKLGVDEDNIKALYPSEFEEGKKKFLEN